MKVAILTQPLHTNFGGTLQAYALQKTLVCFGYQPITIDFRWSHDSRTLFRNFLALVKQRILFKPIHHSFTSNDLKKISKFHSKFICSNINLSPKFYDADSVANFFSDNDFSAVIVGSDQVWRPRYSPGISTFFLDFLSGNKKITKLSYAASFGTEHWEFSDNQSSYFSRLLQEFDAVSVREDSGVSLCNENFNVNAQHVLDPTLLLTVDDYLSLIDTTESVNTGGLFNYVLDRDDNKTKFISELSSKLNLKPFSSYPKYSKKQSFLINDYEFEDYTYPKIETWIKSFYDAEFVITDSFHGTVFSILFNKPFVAIANESRGKARFLSLLKMFDLEERLISDLNNGIDNNLISDIDFTLVNQKLQILRESSKNFLKHSLNSREGNI